MNIKKILLITVIILSILSLIIPVKAEVTPKYQVEAEKLQLLDIFKGTNEGFELTRSPTRIEGLVMLIRLLGKEKESQNYKNEKCVFSDVPSWAVGYVNYAYKNGLTKGIGNNLFGSNDSINSKSYVTFLLRTLKYNDSLGEFQYESSIDFCKPNEYSK